jgi:sugar lactone lactonase YvrE
LAQPIKRLEVRTGRYQEWPTPGFPAAIVPRQQGGVVVAIDRRIALFNFEDRFETLVVPEPNHPENRLNEAAADPMGRLWVGSMQNNIAADGTPKSIEGRRARFTASKRPANATARATTLSQSPTRSCGAIA